MSDETAPEVVPHSNGGHGVHDEKADRRELSKGRMIAWFLLGTLATALLVGFIYMVVATWQNSHSTNDTTQAIRDTQKTNSNLTKTAASNSANTLKLLHLVKSCVTPDGKCAKRGAKAQAGLAGSLNQYNVLASSCASFIVLKGLPPGINQDQLTRMITACVVSQLPDAKKAITDQQ